MVERTSMMVSSSEKAYNTYIFLQDTEVITALEKSRCCVSARIPAAQSERSIDLHWRQGTDERWLLVLGTPRIASGKRPSRGRGLHSG